MNDMGIYYAGGKSSKNRLSIAVIGTGISGMSAAWLLNDKHDVTVFEKDDRIGGHSNTISAREGSLEIPIDTGFIVYNEKNYPNLIALFDHLDVATTATDMSFGVSMDNGAFEYAGSNLAGLVAQPKNLFSGRFWSMLKDLLRFYREAPKAAHAPDAATLTLGQFLRQGNYNAAFIDDHLLPMGAAIWSTPAEEMMAYPLLAFVRFCDNHGLLQLTDRPRWRTVIGGSRQYVNKITATYKDKIRLNAGARAVWSDHDRVFVEDRSGKIESFDHVIMASHANDSLKLLRDATNAEQRLLSAFTYQPNKAILHCDDRLMPKTRKAWCSWNYIDRDDRDPDFEDIGNGVAVTYWMNKLQPLDAQKDWFVTLNPPFMPEEGKIQRSFLYHHPLFDQNAIAAQKRIWNIQGQRNIWFAGAWLGHGFHEDGLQSGLAVAEAVGGVRRPWMVDDESGRLSLPADWQQRFRQEAA